MDISFDFRRWPVATRFIFAGRLLVSLGGLLISTGNLILKAGENPEVINDVEQN